MGLYTSPPSLREFKYDKPTLLVCWWSTLFCTTIILLRVAGRFVRTERLFFEDKVAAAAIIPLYLRMGCVHVILSHGTNNADFSGADLTDSELHNKAVASGLVLASRIFYAATYVSPPPPNKCHDVLLYAGGMPKFCFFLFVPCMVSAANVQRHATDCGSSRIPYSSF